MRTYSAFISACGRKAVFIVMLIMLNSVTYAQNRIDDPPQNDEIWDDYKYEIYTRGDQTFMLSFGVVFPIVFFNYEGVVNHHISPPVGGTGALIFNYYLNSNLFLGGEISGMFLPTIGGSTLYIIPIGFRIGTQFIAGRFEFPIAAVIGINFHTYLDLGYFGAYFKANAAAFFRITNDWAFGLSTGWYFFPEWTKDPSQHVYGNILELNLTAKYQY